MSIVAEKQGVLNTPSEASCPTVAPSAHFSVTSVYTRLSLRTHIVSTRDRDLAFRFLSEALEVDNEPDFAASCGVFSIQFYCSDDECDAVIEAAQGGR